MATEELYKWSKATNRIKCLSMDRLHNKENVPLARALRNNMTKEEKHLWYDYLKPYHKQNNIVFQRQKTFENYIVDFYCPQAKLVIELDGS